MTQAAAKYTDYAEKQYSAKTGNKRVGRVWEVYGLLKGVMAPGRVYTTKQLTDAIIAQDGRLNVPVVNGALRRLRVEGSDIVRVYRNAYVYQAPGDGAPPCKRADENRGISEADSMMTALACLNVLTQEFFCEEYDAERDIRRGLDCFAEFAARWFRLPDDVMARYRFLVSAGVAPLLDEPSYSLSENLEPVEILLQMLLEDGQAGDADADALGAAFEYVRDFRASSEPYGDEEAKS